MARILGGIILGSCFILIMSLFPPLIVLFPMYKMKKTEYNTSKEKVQINLISMLFMCIFIFFGILDWGVLTVYLVFSIPEIVYYLIIKYKSDMHIFDRINLSSIVTFIVLLLLINYTFNDLEGDFNKVKDIYMNTTEISKEELNRIFEYIKSNIYLIVFCYAYISNYLVYWYKIKEIYNFWEINYLWIIPYIVFFALSYLYPENIIYSNGEKIVKLIYIAYGVKAIKVLIEAGKYSKFSKLITALVFILSPTIVFITGVIRSLR